MPSDSEAGAILARATQDGFISAADRDMLAAALGPQGNAAFATWLQDKGIPVRETIAMDPTEDDTDEQTQEGGLSAPFGVRGPSDFTALYQQRMLAAERAAQSEADLRRQTYEQARARLEQSRMGVPTRSEMLLQMSQALLQPSKTHGFGAALGKVMPILAQNETSRRTAEEQRAAQLAQLQQQYASQQAAGQSASAQSQLEALKPLVSLYKPQAAPSMGTWSENLGRYIPKDRPVVVKTGVLNGQRVESMSDGTMRMYGADGSVKLYDAGGNLITTGGQ